MYQEAGDQIPVLKYYGMTEEATIQCDASGAWDITPAKGTKRSLSPMEKKDSN